MRYIPNSAADRQQMLAEIGIDSIEQLFSGIPERSRLRRLLNIPKALTEPELIDYFRERAAKNEVSPARFVGAGIYRHYIPIIIDALISRSEFYAAYTPYQAEIAQGTLQAIFEFQTYIAQLTGMEVANASLYDGSTGLAEAILMAQRVTRKNKLLVARSVHPEYRAVVDTYAKNLGIQIELIGYAPDGRLNLEQLASKLDSNTAAVVVQSPNFFGTIERTHDVAEMAHKHDAMSITNVCEAISIGPSLLRLVLTSRLEYAERDCLADIRDRHCIMLVRHLRDVVGSLDCSKEIGRLHDYGGRVRIQFASELFQVQSSVRRIPDKLDLDAEIFSVSIDDSSILGMHAPSHEELVFSSDTLGHQYGFGQASTAVIERRIRNFHSRQLRDISLKLEDRLQGALRDFGLIRRVGGIELRSRYQGADDDRDVMAINAGSNKRTWLDFLF